jgi:hypothetical protein
MITFGMTAARCFAESGKSEELAAGVVARAEALFSCRMEYEMTSGFANTGQIANSPTPERFAFMGSSWTREWPAFGRRMICHRGKLVEVHSTKQPDGSIMHGARISNEQRMEEMVSFSPYFAGTMWRPRTREYIKSRLADARWRRSETIDGIQVEILEWSVRDRDKYRAFGAITDPLRAGGTLRLYVASELGCALPRIEHVAADGQLETVFEAKDFFDAGSGIYMPRLIRQQGFLPLGTRGFYVRYDIKEVDHVNEPIDDSVFSVELPNGCDVGDERVPGHSVHFRVGEVLEVPADLEDVIVVPSARGGWTSAVVYGVLAGLCLGAAYLSIRYFRRR